MASDMSLINEFAFPRVFFRAKSIEAAIGCEELYVKWEGCNPTGTQKDRAAHRHVLNALSQGYDTVTVGTCGNYGVSMAYFSRLAGIKAVIFVPSRYSGNRIPEILRYGATVVKVDGSYEEAVERSIIAAFEEGWYDANPGGVNGEVAIEAFSELSNEIYNSLGRAPDVVAVPVGNGTTLSGIYLGFVKLKESGLIDEIPKLLGATTASGNQIALSMRSGRGKLIEYDASTVQETEVNEPLISIRSFDGERALEAVLSTGGWIYEFTDGELVTLSNIFLELEGIPTLPASASSLGAILRLWREESEPKLCVAVVTGRDVRRKKPSY